jgi:hypothetical protein
MPESHKHWLTERELRAVLQLAPDELLPPFPRVGFEYASMVERARPEGMTGWEGEPFIRTRLYQHRGVGRPSHRPASSSYGPSRHPAFMWRSTLFFAEDVERWMSWAAAKDLGVKAR